MTKSHFLVEFARWLTPADIIHLARQACWQVRQGKIDPFEFLVGLVFGQMSALGLTLSAQAGCYTEPVSRQGVDQRFNGRAVLFFGGTFQHLLRQSLHYKSDPTLTRDLAARFDSIHLVDSCSFDCPASLAKIYPGCGGDGSAANCKMLLHYEYLHGQFEPLGLLPGKRSDQGLASLLSSILRPNGLLLTDKGFFKLELLHQIDLAKAYFLMPLPRSVSLWLAQPDGTQAALDLADQLGRSDQPAMAWATVYLGTGPAAMPVRLAAFRLSPRSAERHRAALREALRKPGRTPTAAALQLAGWLVLMTNAPLEKLPTHAMSYLYRVRWQIELVFKQCKSVLRLDQTLARHNEHRVQCEIWARLVAAVVLFAWHSHLQEACGIQKNREISFAQVARQIQQQGMTLAHDLIKGGQALTDRLWRLWRHLLRTTAKGRQRTRKTTWQTLNEQWLQLSPN